MSAAPNLDDEYKVGGALPPNATSYVIRQADTELCEGLRAMKFCYVLNSRQMGKSSLRVQARKTLEAEGFACAEIEMRDVCSYQVTQDEFYATIVSHLVSNFELEIDYVQWWHKHTIISPSDRLSKFIQEELLEKINKKNIIFFEEIDSIINLKFKDDFFGFIRACYNRRADNPKYNRLTFVLLGVATPSDLIEDNKRTPFNIDSQAIELKGFQLDETKPLHKGLQGKVSNPEAALEWVLHWTGGQPFLTQKLCKLIYDSSPIQDGDEKRFIKNLVQSRVIDNWLTHDQPEHLRTIRDRILRSGQHKDLLLELYQQILQQGEIEADDSPEQMELRLSGLVVKQDGKLRVYNRICQEIFDQNWVNRALGEWRSVAIQNPAILPEAEQEKRGRIECDRRISQLKSRRYPALLVSVAVTVLVMGVRSLGILQTLELQAYDQLIRLRPAESPDPRILVIKVTEEDIQSQKQELQGLKPERSLSDRSLARLLEKLELYQPRVIGLDIYRDFPVGGEYSDLATRLRQSDHFIAVCQTNESNQKLDIAPPPEIPKIRIGFSNFASDLDGSDRVVRRHLLGIAPPLASYCKTDKSLSLRVALRYLKEKGIKLERTPDKNLKIGSVIFKNLKEDSGGYHKLDIWGYQVMLNYRSGNQSIRQVTLAEVLAGQIDPNWVKDRIVLIGTDATNFPDYHLTPYSTGHWSIEKMPGVVVHAHMVSQILSAVLDNRPLLWVLPEWGEVLWISGWSLIGGLIALELRSKPRIVLGLATAGILGTLYGLCFGLLIQGGWMPLVPSAVALVTTGVTVAAYTASQKVRHEPSSN